MKKKRCWSCKKEKPLSDFRKDASRADGIDHACKKCVNARQHKLRTKVGFFQSKERKARNMVSIAVKKGLILKMKCEKCGVEKTQAHHDDYNYPLSVRWLCDFHHREYHKGLVSTPLTK